MHTTESETWKESLHDIWNGGSIGVGHTLYFLKLYVYRLLIEPVQHLLGIAHSDAAWKELDSSGNTLKVAALGFGRTGTYSLCMALDELGFPCLHTQHLYENEAIMEMWMNKVVWPSMDNGTATLGHPDFSTIVNHGFQATADFPMALYFEQILEEYPDCKFILTVRDSPEQWYRSWNVLANTIVKPTEVATVVPHVVKYNKYLRWLFAILNNDDSFLSVKPPLPDQNRDALIASYEEHNRRVRQIIPEHRLIEYNVKQGWEPLCKYLEIQNCPTHKPFPKTNSTTELQAQCMLGMIIPLAVFLFIIFYIVAIAFEKITGKTIARWVNWKIRVARLCITKTLKAAISGEKEVYA